MFYQKALAFGHTKSSRPGRQWDLAGGPAGGPAEAQRETGHYHLKARWRTEVFPSSARWLSARALPRFLPRGPSHRKAHSLGAGFLQRQCERANKRGVSGSL